MDLANIFSGTWYCLLTPWLVLWCSGSTASLYRLFAPIPEVRFKLVLLNFIARPAAALLAGLPICTTNTHKGGGFATTITVQPLHNNFCDCFFIRKSYKNNGLRLQVREIWQSNSLKIACLILKIGCGYNTFRRGFANTQTHRPLIIRTIRWVTCIFEVKNSISGDGRPLLSLLSAIDFGGISVFWDGDKNNDDLFLFSDFRVGSHSRKRPVRCNSWVRGFIYSNLLPGKALVSYRDITRFKLQLESGIS